jgi:hypothetical protein
MVLPMLGTTVLSVIIARVLGPALLGEQSFIAYVGSLFAAVLVGSFTDAAIRSLSAARGAADHELLGRLTVWTSLGHACIGVVSATVLATVAAFSEHPTAWLVVACTMLVDALGWAYASKLIAERGWAPVSSRRLLWQFVAQALGIAAVLAGLGITGVFAANLVAAVGLLRVKSRHARAWAESARR